MTRRNLMLTTGGLLFLTGAALLTSGSLLVRLLGTGMAIAGVALIFKWS